MTESIGPSRAGGRPGDRYLPGDINRSLPIALLRARETVMARFRPMLAAHDLTEQQWRVLRVLAAAGPMDASDLAEQASLLAPSLTRIIRALEKRRLISRARDEADGRRSVLAITAGALDLIDLVAPRSRAISRRIEALYGPERMERLIDMLNDLAALRPGSNERETEDQ